MNQRMIHNTAWIMAQHLADLFGPHLRGVELQDAREEFYLVCRADLEAFCVQQDRQQQRLRPTSN